MSCGCEGMAYEDCDCVSTVWHEKDILKTRKPHLCCECGKTIPPGERCCMATSLFEGHWDTQYRCAACVVLAEYVAMQNGACPLWGGLSESCCDAGVDWIEYRMTGRYHNAEDDS